MFQALTSYFGFVATIPLPVYLMIAVLSHIVFSFIYNICNYAVFVCMFIAAILWPVGFPLLAMVWICLVITIALNPNF